MEMEVSVQSEKIFEWKIDKEVTQNGKKDIIRTEYFVWTLCYEH